MATVAYLTAEIGLRSDLPTYSGGLGVLAGDHVKAAADLGIDLTAVTLLYRNGYARQHITDGTQTETFPEFDPSTVLEDTGLMLHDELEGRPLSLRLWRYRHVGHGGQRADVIFLDPAVDGNDPADIALGHRLYGGPYGTRIRQEYILGVCGIKALDVLGIEATTLHLNEGHCAFAPLELERRGWSREKIAASTLFTTHTPVPAGHDRFTWDEVDAVVGHLLPSDVKAALDGEMLSMSHLAAHYAGRMNGVSQLNAEVAHTMFEGRTIEGITNGVHHLTWTSSAMAELFDEAVEGWRTDPALLATADESLSDEALLGARHRARAALFDEIEAQTGVRFDEGRLTVGFARRFATYKRADLVFSDLERLLEAMKGKVQFVFSGKAHPDDMGGKALIERVLDAGRQLGHDVPVVFLENYSMHTGAVMTAGVDVWLNTPVRPMEASGTSGMKAAMNGVPNCSILDGWWPEACKHGINGWGIGHQEDDRDDARDAKAVLDVLIDEVLPAWESEPKVWCNLMRQSIVASAPFTAQRMVEDYLVRYNDLS
jgi:starch phosphorylase